MDLRAWNFDLTRFYINVAYEIPGVGRFRLPETDVGKIALLREALAVLQRRGEVRIPDDLMTRSPASFTELGERGGIAPVIMRELRLLTFPAAGSLAAAPTSDAFYRLVSDVLGEEYTPPRTAQEQRRRMERALAVMDAVMATPGYNTPQRGEDYQRIDDEIAALRFIEEEL